MLLVPSSQLLAAEKVQPTVYKQSNCDRTGADRVYLFLDRLQHKATFLAPIGIGLSLFIAELTGGQSHESATARSLTSPHELIALRPPFIAQSSTPEDLSTLYAHRFDFERELFSFLGR